MRATSGSSTPQWRQAGVYWQRCRAMDCKTTCPTTSGYSCKSRVTKYLWRKGSFGSDSETGSQFAERLLTVVSTCRQQGCLSWTS